jgi:hypothetical protein
MIPVFRCQVIETIVSQYCGHWSSAGINQYIRFREPDALEACEFPASEDAWEGRHRRLHGLSHDWGHNASNNVPEWGHGR